MKFRIQMHSTPGTWKYHRGYVDVDAASIHQAVFRAQRKLWPSGSWIVDRVRIIELALGAEVPGST
jgi:hypothetical protein